MKEKEDKIIHGTIVRRGSASGTIEIDTDDNGKKEELYFHNTSLLEHYPLNELAIGTRVLIGSIEAMPSGRKYPNGSQRRAAGIKIEDSKEKK